MTSSFHELSVEESRQKLEMGKWPRLEIRSAVLTRCRVHLAKFNDTCKRQRHVRVAVTSRIESDGSSVSKKNKYRPNHRYPSIVLYERF
jgi:hypothetical protein